MFYFISKFVGNKMFKYFGQILDRNTRKEQTLFVKSDVRFLFFGENFLLLEDRKSIFLSASRSQFVAIGPAKILKIGQRITFFYGQNEF